MSLMIDDFLSGFLSTDDIYIIQREDVFDKLLRFTNWHAVAQ